MVISIFVQSKNGIIWFNVYEVCSLLMYWISVRNGFHKRMNDTKHTKCGAFNAKYTQLIDIINRRHEKCKIFGFDCDWIFQRENLQQYARITNIKKKIYKNNNNNHGIYRHSEDVSQLKYEQCDI